MKAPAKARPLVSAPPADGASNAALWEAFDVLSTRQAQAENDARKQADRLAALIEQQTAVLAEQLQSVAKMAARPAPAATAAPAGMLVVDELQKMALISELLDKLRPPPAPVATGGKELAAALLTGLDRLPKILASWGDARATVEAARRLGGADLADEEEAEAEAEPEPAA